MTCRAGSIRWCAPQDGDSEPNGLTMEPLTSDDPREVAGYRLSARLGAGGMGLVYLAFTQSGRPVALKVAAPGLSDDQEFRNGPLSIDPAPASYTCSGDSLQEHSASGDSMELTRNAAG